jgi:Sulfotransferase domain
MVHGPLIVISLPKAGTYLVAELLKALGYRATGWHLVAKFCTDYSTADFAEARRNPAKYSRKGNPSEFLSQVRPGEFAVGHLPCNDEVRAATARFKRIYLTRDLRTALVSYMRFLADTGRMDAKNSPWYHLTDPRRRLAVFLATTAPKLLETIYERMVGWPEVEAIHHVRFEDLTAGTPQALRVIDALAAWLGITNYDADSILHTGLSAHTVTKSEGLTQLADYWSDDAEKWFHKIGAATLQARLERSAANSPERSKRAA